MIVLTQIGWFGDLIWCQSIYWHYKQQDDVVWPVRPEYVEVMRKYYPDVNWANWEDFSPELFECKTVNKIGDYTVIPLRWAEKTLNLPYRYCMSAKYQLAKLNYRNWKKHAMWVRDAEKESELKSMIPAGDYTFVNKTFRANGTGKVEIPQLQGHVVEMLPTKEFSLFDWAGVIEGAKEIHTVSTSIIYILEMLDLKCPIYIYKRWPDEKDHRNYDYILRTHKYILR